MGGKTETTVEKVENRDPWAPAQPYILDTMRGAKQLYNSDAGKYFFPGNTSVPTSWDTAYALDAMRNRAVYGSPLNSAAQNQALNTIQGDYFNPTNDFYQSGINGGFNNNSENLFKPYTQKQTSPANDYLQDIASNTNPYLDQTFQNASKKIKDQVNANFSKAGRYGSSAHQGKLTEDISKFATDLYGGAYQADQNRRLNAANSMQSAHDSDLSRRMSAAGNIANLRNQNIDRRLSAASGLNQNFQQERARQMQAMMNAGALAANDYADYDRLLQVGTANEEQARRDLQADIDRFNYLEQNPHNRLAQYANLSFGYGNLGGTSTSNSYQAMSKTASPAAAITGAIKGGVSGFLSGGPWGAAIGATTGGISGAYNY